MKAQVPKCRSMAPQGSSGRPVDPKLYLASDAIPYAAIELVKFLESRSMSPIIHISDMKKALATHPLAADAEESQHLPIDKTAEIASLQG